MKAKIAWLVRDSYDEDYPEYHPKWELHENEPGYYSGETKQIVYFEVEDGNETH